MVGAARICLIAITAAVLFFGASASRSDDLTPDAFYGRYEGSGMIGGPSSGSFKIEELARDLDVRIGPESVGFFVEWTTVIAEPTDPEPRRRSKRVNFLPSDRPGIFLEQFAADKIVAGHSWAAINDTTLTVRVLAILEDGSYAIQTYHRTLTRDGMFLQFVSDQDGQALRTVAARLTKVE